MVGLVWQQRVRAIRPAGVAAHYLEIEVLTRPARRAAELRWSVAESEMRGPALLVGLDVRLLRSQRLGPVRAAMLADPVRSQRRAWRTPRLWELCATSLRPSIFAVGRPPRIHSDALVLVSIAAAVA